MSTQIETIQGKQLYVPEVATITNVKQVTEMERWFEVELPGGKDLGHKPMQFVEVSVLGIGEAPFSITSSPTKKGSFEMCIRDVGSLSHYLHTLEPGAKIGIRGPMGNGLDPAEFKGQDVLIVAGGIGLVPVRSMINYVIDKRSDFGKLSILYGCKTPQEILYRSDLDKWEANENVELLTTVDRADGSWKGNVGVITSLFRRPDAGMDTKIMVAGVVKNLMPGIKVGKATKVLIVGPPIMFKFVLMELDKMGVPNENIFMSLERRMKCGVGKCGHCQINHLYACQDGPVFRYDQIMEMKEAL